MNYVTSTEETIEDNMRDENILHKSSKVRKVCLKMIIIASKII